MPDSFDPDAWPHAGDPTPSNGNGGSNKKSDEPEQAAGSHARNNDEFDFFGGDDEIDLRDEQPAKQDEDFGTFNYDFDDDDSRSTRQQPAPVATSTKQGNEDWNDDPYANPYDSEYDDYDNSAGGTYAAGDTQTGDYDDDYDRYDDFEDREPSHNGGGVKRLLIGALAVVFLIGALSFGAMALLGSGDETAQPPTTTAAPAQPPAPAADPNAQAPAATPAQTGGQPPAEVTKTLDDALTAWGRFSVSGDLDEVRPYFVPTSKQFAHFESTEAPAIKANPPSGAPFRMAMANDRVVSQGADGNWKIAGTVVAERQGEQPQNFRWEFTFTRASANDPWQILQVRQF